MKNFSIIFFFLFANILYSQENLINEKKTSNAKNTPYEIKNPEKKYNPHLIALLGIVPGLGQVHIGNTGTGIFQFGLFYSISELRYFYFNKPDYIEHDDREVKFELGRTLVADRLDKNNLLYREIPFLTETPFVRNVRLFKEGKFYEINPLIKYGEYSRTSRSSFYSDNLGNPTLSVIFYSVYSGFRDSGGLGELRKNEKFEDLALAPFKPKYFSDYRVFTPLLFEIITLAISQTSKTILAPKSLVNDGSLVGGAFITGISPAIGEEAFFRGYLNYSLMQRFGPWVGGGVSGVLFSLAHAGNSDAKEGFFFRSLFGFYQSYLHYSSSYDLGPSIALHFWWNFILSIAQIKYYKADSNYNKSQQDVHFMPLFYQFRF